jgi:hypothetical protein
MMKMITSLDGKEKIQGFGGETQTNRSLGIPRHR